MQTTTPPEEEKTYNNPKETFEELVRETFEELVRRIPISQNLIDLLILEKKRFFEDWKNSRV